MICFSDVCFGYRPSRLLFADLNLTLPAGHICGLLGKNGVGKTSLLKLISGLRFAQSGEVRILGQSSAGRPADLLKELFFLPEELALPNTTVNAYLKIYGRFYPRFDEKVFWRYLESFEVDAKASISALSFGQKKKFALAFGLASGCRLMLLDEPTNGLDIPSKRQFRQILASEYAEQRLIIISTHQARDLESIIDSVLILDKGKVIFNHSLAAVSELLQIQLQAEPPANGEALYAEKAPAGYWVVTRAEEAGQTVDLEVLFNTVISNPQVLKEIFQKEVGNQDEE